MNPDVQERRLQALGQILLKASSGKKPSGIPMAIGKVKEAGVLSGIQRVMVLASVEMKGTGTKTEERVLGREDGILQEVIAILCA